VNSHEKTLTIKKRGKLLHNQLEKAVMVEQRLRTIVYRRYTFYVPFIPASFDNFFLLLGA